jgi:hypothetical protein
LAGYMETYPLPKLFGAVALTAMIACVVMFILVKPIRKLMGGVH